MYENLLIVQLVVSALVILISTSLVYWYSKKHNIPIWIAVIGGVFFIIVQIIHIPLVFITQPDLTSFLMNNMGDELIVVLIISIYLGLLAGLFEEIGRYIVFKKFVKERTIKSGKLFGLGWGGMEAILLVGILASFSTFSLISFFQNNDLTTYKSQLLEQGLSEDESNKQIALLETQKNMLDSLEPPTLFISLYERIVTIIFHTFASVLVMITFITNNKKNLYVAIFAHFLTDASAVFINYKWGIMPAEIIITIMVAIFVYYTLNQIKKLPSNRTSTSVN